MLFYVPPLSPVMAAMDETTVRSVDGNFFHDIENSRIPLRYLARLFGAGHEGKVLHALKKMKAVRIHRRAVTVGDISTETAEAVLQEADCNPAEAEAIYALTSLCTFDDRFVIPPMHREEALEMLNDDVGAHKASTGFGFVGGPQRGS